MSAAGRRRSGLRGGRLSRFRHRNPNSLRHNGRRMRDVILITQEKLQRMRSGRQVQLCLRLPGTEMQMVEIIGDGLIEWRELGINQEMVMS